jgi:hypothetical protein
VAPWLLEPPVNALRVALHPEGMAPRIANLAEWSGHLLHRLRRQLALTGDEALGALHDELAGLPGVAGDDAGASAHDGPAILVPLRLRRDGDELAFLSTVTVFGTALDITLAELTVEAFYPADAATAQVLAAQGEPVTPTQSSRAACS